MPRNARRINLSAPPDLDEILDEYVMPEPTADYAVTVNGNRVPIQLGEDGYPVRPDPLPRLSSEDGRHRCHICYHPVNIYDEDYRASTRDPEVATPFATPDGVVYSHPECAARFLVRCTHCGDRFHSQYMLLLDDTEFRFCRRCFYTDTAECACCHTRLQTRQMVRAVAARHNEVVARLNDPFDRNAVIRDQTRVCTGCMARHPYAMRSINGVNVWQEDAERPALMLGRFSNLHALPVYVDSDASRQWRSSLHRHGARPTTLPFFDTREALLSPRPEQLYLGFELEVERNGSLTERETMVADLCHDRPWLYAQQDSSIHDGIEFTSCPMTPEFVAKHRESLAEFLADLRRHGYRSYDTQRCGLHVHLSRPAFTPLTLFKFQMLLMYLPQFAIRLSEREEHQLKRWAKFPVHNRTHVTRRMMVRTLISRARRREMDVDRYQAVNLMRPETVEVRIFRGTLNEKSFFKALEFCVAAHDFAATRPVPSCWYRPFRDWLLGDAGLRYPYLAAWVAENAVSDDDLRLAPATTMEA